MKFIFYQFLFIFLLINLAKGQTTINLSPVKDNTLYEESPGNSNGSGQNIFSGQTDDTHKRRALMSFAIANSIPAGSVITAVTLTLTCNRTITGPVDMSLYRVTGNWGEGTSVGAGEEGAGIAASNNDATWANTFFPGNFWTTAGGDFAPLPSSTTTVNGSGVNYTWSSPDMISDVQFWLDNPASDFGWILIGDETVSPTTKRFSSRENATAANRPKLSITYNSTIPIILHSFKARKIRQGVLLNWETEHDLNNDFYLVQHSTNGTQFSSIGSIAGSRESTLLHSYQFIHAEGVFTGNHFYRVEQVNLDRSKHYSNVIVIKVKEEGEMAEIFPNPLNDNLVLQGYSNEPGDEYIIFDALGNRMKSGPCVYNKINVSHLSAGIYFLRLISHNVVIRTLKFVKAGSKF